jgi:hypothetical protein
VTVEANGGVGRATAITGSNVEGITYLAWRWLPQDRGAESNGGNSDRRRHDHMFLGTVLWYRQLRHVTDLPAPKRYSVYVRHQTVYSRRYIAPGDERSYRTHKIDLVINWDTKIRVDTSNTPSKKYGYLTYHIILIALQIRLSSNRHACMRLLLLRDGFPPDSILRSDDRWRLRDVLSEDLGPEEPREPDEELVADELLGRDLEDLCEIC